MKIRMFGVVCLSILVIVLTSLLMVNALSDENEELVNDLRWKYYGSGFITTETQIDWLEYDINIDYEWWSMTFDDETGILYVETQDGKWFVEMKAVEGNNNGNDD